ncbi:MAG: glycoside hydrolase family 2 TIM barrel-domain containing protein [Bacteroidota bacterium]
MKFTQHLRHGLSTILILCFCNFSSAFQNLPPGFPKTEREKININTDWNFYLEKNQRDPIQFRGTDKDWEKVNLPHGLELFSNDLNGVKDDDRQLTFQRAVGWYSRTLTIEGTPDQKIFLEFEGVHQLTHLWVNGQLVGKHEVSGYTPFHFDITKYVKLGAKNTITVSADNRRYAHIPPDGHQLDFIKFGGLYRDVYLVKTNPMHISFPWEEGSAGVHLTTPAVTATNATITVKTHIKNESAVARPCTLLTRIIDADGRVVLRMQKHTTITAGGSHTFRQTGGITENLHLWSPANPYLYRVNSLVLEGGKAIDFVENPLGIRWFEFVRGEGFFLNGENIELVGANRHQAYPFIGDAVPNSLHWKDAYQMKQAGFNIVRLAHYPHDNAFIEACDRLGLLVFEEPPTWIGIGNEDWFANLEEAARRMIRNHRNHPSILMWGAAINHRGPVERLHYLCKEEDPYRPTASNGSPWTGPRNSGICDLYTPMDYQLMPIYDDEISFLCEHGSSPDALRNQTELSRSRASKNRVGVAVWTAHDYHSYKPNRQMYPRRVWSWYRVPNEPFYWYQSELLEQAVVHIADERVSKNGQVVVFSNCQEVQLYHNGKLVARQFPDVRPETQHVHHPSFTFDFDWKTGKLEAIGLRNGQEVQKHVLEKGGQAKRLKLIAEMDEQAFLANGSDIKMIRAMVLDEKGNLLRDARSLVTFSVEGAGRLIGEKLKDANPNEAYYGIASAMIQSSSQAGLIRIKASAEGLQSDELDIQTEAATTNYIAASANPIYDLVRERIDIGGNGQFLQFDWQAWTGGEDKTLKIGDGDGMLVREERIAPVHPSSGKGMTYSLKAFPGASIRVVESASDPLKWTTNWGQSSELAYLTMDGLETNDGQSILLKIQQLPKGIYRIRSWHHLSKAYKKVQDGYEIEVDDASSKRSVRSIRPTSGHYMEKKQPASCHFKLTSDGQNDISLLFKSTEKGIPMILNGIEIEGILP